jgi:four helix bundle protein
MGRIRSVSDLIVYGKAYEMAMEIFRLSKTWPKEEKYSLTDQIRRSSRSVCANLHEAWAKRRYKAHFISKLTDVDSENGETITWLHFAFDCSYLKEKDFKLLKNSADEISKMLSSMLYNPEPFLLKVKKKIIDN